MFTYYNSKVTKEREAQIDRINEQVRDLYGPLLACVTASKSAFDAMVRQHSPDGTKESFIQAVREDAEGKEAQAYRWALCKSPAFMAGKTQAEFWALGGSCSACKAAWRGPVAGMHAPTAFLQIPQGSSKSRRALESGLDLFPVCWSE